MATGWEALARIETGRLVEARLQLHWAAQAAAGVGKLLLPHREDWSEQSFAWDQGLRALMQGEVAAAARAFRVGLRAAPAALLVVEGEAVVEELALGGRTLGEAYEWLEGAVGARVGRAVTLERPGTEMPPHPVGAGGRFATGDGGAFTEIGRWFGNGHRLLSGLAAREPGASRARCWPHHFDLAVLIALDAGGDPETARSLGVGLQPGDAGRPAPYLYVTPWPHPDEERLPPLTGGGSWNTEGWVGAVLEAAELLAEDHAEGQERRARRFADGAVAVCRALLERR